MSVMAPVPEDHPLMIAWNAYKATDDFANSRRWAAHNQHLDGSLWAAFEQGWRAAADSLLLVGMERDSLRQSLSAAEARVKEMREALEVAECAIDDCQSYRSHLHHKELAQVRKVLGK